MSLKCDEWKCLKQVEVEQVGGLWWGGVGRGRKKEGVLEVTRIHRELIQHDIEPRDKVEYMTFQELYVFLIVITMT